jgi:tetratricopeptide (TPR) repeat protein
VGTFRPNKKVVLSAVGVIAVLGLSLGAGVGLRILQQKNENSKSTQDSVYKGTPLPGDAEEVQNLRLDGDDKAATAKIDEALNDKDTSTEERYTLYIQQGNIAADKQDLNAAIQAYTKAEAVKETYEITKLLGLTWEDLGDKAKSVEYYKKALPLTPSGPMQQSNKEYLETKIRNLGGTL